MPSGEPAILDIDATISGLHSRTSTITKNPIEDGSNKSDHVINENESFTIEGVVSDTPLSIITPVRNLLTTANEELQTLTTVAGSIGGLLQSPIERAQNAFIYLDELWRNHIPFKIISGFKSYDPVLFASLTIIEVLQNGRAVRFTGTIEQLQIAITKLQTIPPDESIAPDVVHTGSAKQDLGKKSTKAITKTVEKKSSLLFDILFRSSPGF